MSKLLPLILCIFVCASAHAQNELVFGFKNPQYSCTSSEVIFDYVFINKGEDPQYLANVELCFIVPDTELYDLKLNYPDGSAMDTPLDFIVSNSSNATFGFSGPLKLMCVSWSVPVTIEVGPSETLNLGTLRAKTRTHLSNGFGGHIMVIDNPANGSIVVVGDLIGEIETVPNHFNWTSPANPNNVVFPTDCPCIDYKNINEHPSSNLVNHVSTQIISVDTVGYNEYGHYRAGDNILLNEGFEVRPEAEFDADIETCPDDCLTDPVCEGPPCPFPAFELDAEGNRYVPNQILFSAPSSAGLPIDYATQVKENLDNILSVPPSQSTIVECLCDEKIALYEVDPGIQINEECCIGGSTGQVYEDGGAVYSVNHYVEADVVHADAFAMPPSIPRPNQQIGNGNSTAIKVAYLDSGVNTAMVPDGSLLYSENPSDVICDSGANSVTDYIGWNFIDNTDDVSDDRGHGTAVFFSHISGLYQQGLSENNQSALIVKVLDECGVGTAFSTSCGLYYAAAKGVSVINASWGLYVNNPTLQLAIEEVGANTLIVTSAGNRSKDLSGLAHYPSGYAYDYPDALNPTEIKVGLEKVFEVANICRPVELDSCDPNLLEELWIGSNFRTDDPFFAEPGVNIEAAIQTYSKVNIEFLCAIVGTSYAAPQFTSGLVYRIANSLSTVKSKIYQESQHYSPTQNLNYYSIVLNNPSCN